MAALPQRSPVQQRWRLCHGRDDAGDAGQLVGQSLVDQRILQVHGPQHTVPFRLVHWDEVTFRSDVSVEQEVNSGLLVQWHVAVGQLHLLAHVKCKVVLKHRHVGGEQRVEEIINGEGGLAANPHRVEPGTAISGMEFRMKGE